MIPFPARRIQRHDILGGLIHEYHDTARIRPPSQWKTPAQRM
ncbi:hypothetical protein [Streptomyces sp. SID13588]|nr:hypothetical protein [Streptomyces sp. SID13588]